MGGVDAEHRDVAGVAGTVALEDLDGGGLAGPVRPEEPEDLLGAYLEVDAVDPLHVAVRLAQSMDLDDRRHGMNLRGSRHVGRFELPGTGAGI
jgi:hypothetical protein